MTKEVFGSFSVLIAFISYIPYTILTIRHAIRPHLFSWIIWGTMNAITFVAQESRGAGAGGWATGLSAVGCFFVALLAAFFHGERNITRSDWAVFLASLMTIPLWYFTSDPLWAVILLSLINMAAFYPTIRKTLINPHEELMSQFMISNLKHVVSLAAMMNYTAVTLIYPITALFLNTGTIALVLRQRRIHGRAA